MLSEKTLANLLSELKLGLKGIYGDRLKEAYLYGSYARGDQREESDVDVLIVLDQIDDYACEVMRAGQLGCDLSLKYGVSVFKVFYSQDEWGCHDSPFLENVWDEAVELAKFRSLTPHPRRARRRF